MRILVVDAAMAEAKKAADVALGRGHVAYAVAGVQAAMTVLRRLKPDVAILDSSLALHSGEFIKAMREDQPLAHVVLGVSKGTAFNVTDILDGGVDDIAAKPYDEKELAVRLSLAERFLEAQSQLGTHVAAGPPVAAVRMRLPAWAERLSTAQGWISLANNLQEAFKGFLGSDFSVTNKPFPTAPTVYSGTLSAAEHGIELQFGLIADRTSSRAIASSLLGDDVDENAIDDLLLEMVNTAIGGARTELLGDGFDFTVGIPTKQPVKILSGSLSRYELIQSIGFEVGGARLGVMAGVNASGSIQILGADVREGMVIARDVLNENGMLVVRAGTRVTATAAAHLARLAGKLMLEVMTAA